MNLFLTESFKTIYLFNFSIRYSFCLMFLDYYFKYTEKLEKFSMLTIKSDLSLN